ncbi:MAG TPA: type VI secretion system tube protein Hcp [Phycisphaerae bacterium]|jgi:type VI secretion system secreted protein Hcp
MAFDSFLELYDSKGKAIEGESIDKVHSKKLQVKSYSFGLEHPVEAGLGTGMASGKTKMLEFEVELLQSKGSPVLFELGATGDHLSKAILYTRKAGSTQQDYCIWTFIQLFVTGFTVSAGDGADAMVEKIKFAYTGLHYEYRQQDEKGAVSKSGIKAGWDVKKNDKFTV